MALEQRTIDRLESLLKRRFPDWTDFNTPGFVKDETQYKRKASATAIQVLAASEFRSLLDQGQVDVIEERLEAAARQINLLYQSVPSSGDLRILYHPGLDRPAFYEALYRLLWGSGASPQRLQNYIDFVKARGLPNYWTFPTYYLFLCHPDTELFVKPGVTKDFLAARG